MRKLPILIVSAALLASSVAPSFAASAYENLQPGAPVVKVDDWRHRDQDTSGDFYRNDWRNDRDRDWHHRHHHHGGRAAAIIGGIAAGAIIGGALAPDRRDRYYDDY